MPTTPPAENGSDARLRMGRGHKIVALIAGAILCGAVVILVALISTASSGETSVLIGTFDSARLVGLAVIAALASIAAGLCAITVPRAWLLLLVPARVAAIGATGLAGIAWLLTSSATVVPLVADGCETGYVVQEESFLLAASGTVYRRDGLLVTVAGRFAADDGYHPFADGAYTVVRTSDSLRVWHGYAFDPSAAPVPAAGEPNFTLPLIMDRTLSCGVTTGARNPLPPAPTARTYHPDEARAGVRDMITASMDAAIGPTRDARGRAFAPDELSIVSSVCGQSGTQSGVAFAFVTADNAVSLERILQTWDAAGYLSDRAMQQDIRYSDALPVARMSIRDATSIDGFLHIEVRSQCSVSRSAAG